MKSFRVVTRNNSTSTRSIVTNEIFVYINIDPKESCLFVFYTIIYFWKNPGLGKTNKITQTLFRVVQLS